MMRIQQFKFASTTASNRNKNKPIVHNNNKTEKSQLFTTTTASLHRIKNNLGILTETTPLFTITVN